MAATIIKEQGKVTRPLARVIVPTPEVTGAGGWEPFDALAAAEPDLLEANQVDVANAVSYALGICSSFVLGKLWVFSSKNPHWHAEALRFLIGAAACWSLQWLCFHFLLPLVGEPIAYICGMVVYTACNYIYNKCVTFR